ncbi:MAG: glycosyltransferase family protein [Bryobacterales bacterium]|nr:glycosyltransferase family protein [Bryobacterales bacterium]
MRKGWRVYSRPRRAALSGPGGAEDAETWYELGNAYHLGGKLEQAALAYGQAVRLDPGHARAQHNLGVTWMMANRAREALACFEAAVAADPGYADAHNNRGIVLQLAGRLEEAIDSYGRALASEPGDMRAAYNMGVALASAGRLEEAEQTYRRVLRGGAGNSSAHNNLGNVLVALGRAGEAISHYQRARWYDRSSPEAPLNLGVARLLTGDYARGWEGFEYRAAQPGVVARHFDRPRWRGEPLAGRRILLHAEQGLGDTIQFSRFAPVLGGQGATVIVECQPAAAALLATVPGVAEVVAAPSDGIGFDYHLPLMSVAGVLRVTAATIPAKVPYLFPRRAVIEQWKRTMAGLTQDCRRRRVGLAWAGNPRHPNDRNRSMPLARLKPLLEMDGVQWFSLQKGGDGSGAGSFDLGPLLTDLEQTAAAIEQLDLVISVDTVVAHLAGALGRPVWLLAPFAPDWRWMLDRSDSPWYPSMRLFRQRRRGDWDGVIGEVRRALIESAFAVDQ